MDRIQHIIVLMLENRSFDHMLGYLQYPPGTPFEGLRGREASFPNRVVSPGGEAQEFLPGDGAKYFIDPGPDHSHEAVMRQLLEDGLLERPYRLTNAGFALDYDRLHGGHGGEALQCFLPEKLPVLATLAKEFAVCDHWFCSVPGGTWPNRNFAHAAHSDAQVNIVTRAYHNPTIYEQLNAAGLDWVVYYGGFPAQTMAFTDLWQARPRNWLQRFKPVDNLYRAIRNDRLPHYSFVEPDMLGKTSDSQHPGVGGEQDFRAGERLIWRMYDALRRNPAVFEKTLFLVTYDEHGGFFDHVPPPQGPEWAVQPPYREDNGYIFEFDLLGARVPAVLISPWIARGTVDQTIYDHTSIPATVRRILGVAAGPLSARDAHANTFDRVLNLDAPRRSLPELPEPFVNEELRKLAPGLELRDSLAWILRDLLWEGLSELPVPSGADVNIGGQGFGLLGEEPETAGEAETTADLEADPEAATDLLLADIGEELDPETQAILDEPEPPAPEFGVLGGSPLANALQVFRHKVERLIENQSLVDDAMRVAEWYVHNIRTSRNVILRTAAGRSLAAPGLGQIRQELEGVLSRPDPTACAWLADYEDRWLTLFASRQLTFHDRRPDRAFFIDHVNLDAALQLFAQLQAGKLKPLREAFRRLGEEMPV